MTEPSPAPGLTDGPHRQDWVRRILADWWFAGCAITLILASDYKFRTRDPRTAVAGGIDSAILLELLLYAMVLGFLVLRYAGPVRFRRADANLYLAGFFVALMVLSVLYTAYPEYALVRAGQMCILMALVLAVVSHGSVADMHRFAHVYIVVAVLSVGYGVARPSPPVNQIQAGRFTWLAIHPTVSGVILGIAFLLTVAYLANGSRPRAGIRWPRWVYIGALVVVGGGLLGSQTRGAVAGAFGGLIVVLVTARGGRALVDLLAALVIVLMGVSLAAGGLVVTYFERGEDAEQLATLNSRTNLWETAADAIEKRPVFGYGVTSSRGIFYDETGLGGGHNAVVNVFVELGFVGFLTWMALSVTLVWGVGRLPFRQHPFIRFDRALLLGIVTFLLIDGVFFEGPGSVTNVASTWFFVCVAWLAILRRRAEEEDRRAAETDRPISWQPRNGESDLSADGS